MSRLTLDPPLPRKADPDEPFLQRISLHEGRAVIGACVWYFPGGADGAIQLIELRIAEAHRRQGHAGALLAQAVAQARTFAKSRGVPLRHIWVAIEQKSQVLARSFLTRHGFHHTSTIPDLLKDQDLLVYVKSFE